MALENAQRINVTIANGQTTSDAASDDRATLVALVTPAALTGVALTFSVSADGVNYATLYKDDGNAYSVTAAASRFIALDYAKFVGARFVKVVSGSAEAAQRTIVTVWRALA